MAQSKTLAELVQDLPAELYNNILDYTLAIDEDTAVITKDWKPPVQLQIDRATRAEVTEKFYRDTVFTYRDSGFNNHIPSLFFGVLCEKHASMITKFRVPGYPMYEKGTPRGDYFIGIQLEPGRYPDVRRQIWKTLEDFQEQDQN